MAHIEGEAGGPWGIRARLKGDSLLTFYKVQSFVSLDCFLQRSVWLLMVFKIHVDFQGQTIRIVT